MAIGRKPHIYTPRQQIPVSEGARCLVLTPTPEPTSFVNRRAVVWRPMIAEQLPFRVAAAQGHLHLLIAV